MIESRRFAESRIVPFPSSRIVDAACILVIPFVLLALNRNLFINPAGEWIDPWVYTGSFVGFPTRLQLFGQTYYVARLSWLLPGVLVHSLLPALAANYTLHFAFFYALLFATYELVRAVAGRGAAILVTIVMAWNPIVVASLSWDYVDGAGILFLVLTLLCLEKVVQNERLRWGWGAAAGVGLACMATSNLFLIVMWPIALLFLVVRVGFGRWRLVAAVAMLAAGGAALTFGLFGAINRMYGGPWLFLARSIEVAGYLATTPSAWRDNTWHHRASWLVLPATATLGATLDLLLRHGRRPPAARAMQVTLLAAVAVWTGFELRGVPVLQFYFYSSYLAPLSLLALALQAGWTDFASRLEHLVLPIATMALLSVAHWLFLTSTPNFTNAIFEWPVARAAYDIAWFGPPSVASYSTLLAVAGGLIAVLSLRLAPVGAPRWFGFVLGLVLGCAAVPTHWPSATARNIQASYAEVVQIDRYVEKNISDRSLRFWYDADADSSRSLRSISSTYFWGYSLVNERLPALTADEATALPANTRFVFLVPNHQDIDRARQSLRSHGLDLSVVDGRQFGGSEHPLSVVLADLVREPQLKTR